MGRDTGAHDALVDLLRGGEGQVLCGGDVADEVGPVRGGEGSADRRNPVIVARRDVGHERPEHVEGFPVAHPLLEDDVCLYLVYRDVARPLHDHLDSLGMGLVPEFRVDQQFLDLGAIRRVVHRAGPHAVAHREGDLVLLHDLKEVVELRVERVLLLVVEHPRGHECAAAGDQPAVTPLVLETPDGLPVDPGMDCHEVGPKFRLLGGDAEEVVLLHVHDRTVFPCGLDECLVERDASDREAGRRDHTFPDLDEVSARGELHQGVGPCKLCLAGLFDLHLDVDDIRRGPDGGVHLCAQPFADPADLHVPVGGDRYHDVAAGNSPPDELLGHPFLPGHDLHLIGDDAGPSIVNKAHA
ncbi:MAG: hypothetical protein A4E37_01832 [Methanoregulaceae archaeon PtaB.Bin056]|nr:MAG: hypothetical protein A4E37_01832 [Methanoregulaceae archaeon PtaB.Bin056]